MKNYRVRDSCHKCKYYKVLYCVHGRRYQLCSYGQKEHWMVDIADILDKFKITVNEHEMLNNRHVNSAGICDFYEGRP
jgi:hypothetical protein